MSTAVKNKRLFDDKFEVLGIIGRGSRSVVYHARHANNPSSEVALKVLLPQKDTKKKASELLRKEALAMISSRHRYVIRLEDFHSVEDLCYLAMEYAPERDLRTYLSSQGGRLSIAQAEMFLLQAAEALNFVHKAGIIHRDIKPDNILVANANEIRLGDFGVALLPGEEATIEEIRSGIGTLAYLAPEVLEGRKFTVHSDIYSLGVTFYELLSGVNPFKDVALASQLEARKLKNIGSLADLVPEAPTYLVETIMRAISAESEQRFSSAQELVKSLTVSKTRTRREVTPVVVPVTRSSPEIAETLITDTLVTQTSENPQLFQPSNDPYADFLKELQVDALAETSLLHSSLPKEIANTSPQPKTPLAPVALAVEETQDLTTTSTMVFNPAAVTQPPQVQVNPQLKFQALFGVLALLVLLKLFSGNVEPVETVVNVQASPSLLAPEISFPQLPAGLYQGEINNFVPGKSIPLTIQMNNDQSRMLVLVGLAGWQPVQLDPKSFNTIGKVKLTSAGFIIEMVARPAQGEIVGEFKNALGGQRGQWTLRLKS